MKLQRKPEIVDAYTFEEFIAYGRRSGEKLDHNGMPLSFHIHGCLAVRAHDACYWVDPDPDNSPTPPPIMTVEDVLIISAHTGVSILSLEEARAEYDFVPDAIPDDAPPDVTPSEALFGFMAWLTSRSTVSGPFSGSHGASEAAELVAEFYMSQGFAEPREGVYPKNLKPYPKEPSAPVAGPAPTGRELVEGVSEDSIDSICHCGKDITNAANHRCDECRRSIFGNTTAPKDANALGFANVYPDGVSDLFPHESDARKAAGSEAIRIAVPLYDHPVTEAECISAFEKLGHKRFASHVTGEIWFTKNHSGGDHE